MKVIAFFWLSQLFLASVVFFNAVFLYFAKNIVSLHSDYSNNPIVESHHMRKEIIHRINQLGKEGKPFLFVIDYLGN